ncbi:acyl-CoA N-acyltransferase [Ochromonadaceae sp. CCMP2298]|nr:acyl-CoA N-acyltransferase [Ochromonadaceae sp. CCMP2298]|mmetsp:Transcript_29459/g.65340  ORF Transcript_29459/g.65340 Transcript_29459/m.65340 type:complete len:413 (-) Transcript_29459:135-1373(-)
MPGLSRKGVEVGGRYLVQWKNGQKHCGEIIEVRSAKGKRQSTSSAVQSPDSFDYYVHYPNFDRRLDEWVPFARIGGETGVEEVDGSGKKKRKWDDGESKTEERHKEEHKGGEEHDEITKVKNIQSIVLGKFNIDAWYFSPYPEEYAGDDKLHVCEFCLKYMKKEKPLRNHSFKCNMRSPPGREIYREGDLSMFEIDGKDHKIYCQNLCLLSKLFLDHKTLYYDVEPFLFYVLCEVDRPAGNAVSGVAGELHHIVGYFSKEKHSAENYNLACILTFPPYQRKGYGKFLMSLSYELTKREHATGSPEKPLSDLGYISYRSYWTFVLLNIFLDRDNIPNMSVQEISRLTGFKTDDILNTLQSLNMIKYWKGQHVISVSQKALDSHVAQAGRVRLCNPSCLHWSPPTDKPKASKLL